MNTLTNSYPPGTPVNRCAKCGQEYLIAHMCSFPGLSQKTLTEEDVRRIVREEFKKLSAGSFNG